MPEEPRKYQRTQREYAQLYDKSLATIKRWWKAGRPLDDPDAMGELLSPRGRKADDEDADFEGTSRVPPTDGEDSTEENIPIRLDESFFVGSGVLAEIERLKKAGRERSAAYFSAIANRANPTVLRNRFGEWIAIVEALRKLEKDAPKIRKDNALSVDVAETEAVWAERLAAFRAAATNLPGRAAAKLLSAPRTFEAFVELLEREIETLFRSLVTQAEAAAAAAETDAEACAL